jgi:hypothetical protein
VSKKAVRRRPGTSRKPPTARQKDFVAVVRRLVAATGELPTAAAVAREMGITRKGALQQLDALRVKGYLTAVEVVIRDGWNLTQSGEALLAGE